MKTIDLLHQKVFKFLISVLGPNVEKRKAGRRPKVSDLQLCALYILSYIANAPVLTLAKLIADPSIQSCHLFRKTKTKECMNL